MTGGLLLSHLDACEGGQASQATGHVKLADCVDLLSGFAFKSQQFTDDPNDVALVKGENVSQGRVLWDISKRWPLADWAKFEKFQLAAGDVVIAMDRPWVPAGLKWCFIREHDPKALLVQRCCRLRAKPGLMDQTFLRCVIGGPGFESYIKPITTGVNIPHISGRQILDYAFRLPDLPTQRKIAGILSAYDDLIENNLRRIKILEEMAQSLYREWFVHFRFPGHESARFIDSSLGRIPKGWEVRKILDFAEVIYGFSFKANRFNTAGEGVPVVRIRNIQDGKSETYSEEEGDSKHRIKNGDILVGMDGDFHMTIWSGGDAWQNQRVAKFRPKGAMGNYLIFLTLEKPIHYFDSTITGTTVAHLGDSHIKTIEFPSPPEALMRKASDLLEPMAQKQLNLRRRNQALRHTRDLLLPKLLGS